MTQKPKPPAAPAPQRVGERHTYRAEKPIFVSLKEGESIRGVFLSRYQGTYGPAYRLKTPEGVRILSGNRFQLDAILDEMESDEEAFAGGLAGHLIEVRRLRGNLKTSAGRTVGQYEVDHIYEGCPHGCAPI